METREILKKADKGTLTWEKVDGGKIRFTSLGWDDAVVTKPNEVLEIAMLDTIPALVKATKDKDWIVRAAAIESIAQRGDASLLPHVINKFTYKNPKVRYSAAAAVIRLSGDQPGRTAKNDR